MHRHAHYFCHNFLRKNYLWRPIGITCQLNGYKHKWAKADMASIANESSGRLSNDTEDNPSSLMCNPFSQGLTKDKKILPVNPWRPTLYFNDVLSSPQTIQSTGKTSPMLFNVWACVRVCVFERTSETVFLLPSMHGHDFWRSLQVMNETKHPNQIPKNKWGK